MENRPFSRRQAVKVGSASRRPKTAARITGSKFGVPASAGSEVCNKFWPFDHRPDRAG